MAEKSPKSFWEYAKDYTTKPIKVTSGCNKVDISRLATQSRTPLVTDFERRAGVRKELHDFMEEFPKNYLNDIESEPTIKVSVPLDQGMLSEGEMGKLNVAQFALSREITAMQPAIKHPSVDPSPIKPLFNLPVREQ